MSRPPCAVMVFVSDILTSRILSPATDYWIHSAGCGKTILAFVFQTWFSLSSMTNQSIQFQSN